VPGILPPQACGIVVPAATTGVSTCFIGLAIHGDRPALEALLTGAAKRDIRGKILEGEAPLEAMITFGAVDRSAALSLFRDAVAGRFGRLKVEVVVAPASGASDGLDMDGEITVEQPSFLASEPK
jgi:hypothetical protein